MEFATYWLGLNDPKFYSYNLNFGILNPINWILNVIVWLNNLIGRVAQPKLGVYNVKNGVV